MYYVLGRVVWLHLGTVSAIACAIQCALLPILFSVLPLFGWEFSLGKNLEICVIGIAAVLGVITSVRGFFWHHHNKLVLSLFMFGLFILAFSFFLGATTELVLHAVAAILLVVTHLYNHSLCKQCEKCHIPPS